jgi:hypothetical protein
MKKKRGRRIFSKRGAFSRDSADGRYRVDFGKMREAVDALANGILVDIVFEQGEPVLQ